MPASPATVIGSAIRAERKRQKLSQEELALVAGLGSRVIGEIENGKETARLDGVTRLLDALGLELQVAPRRKHVRS